MSSAITSPKRLLHTQKSGRRRVSAITGEKRSGLLSPGEKSVANLSVTGTEVTGPFAERGKAYMTNASTLMTAGANTRLVPTFFKITSRRCLKKPESSAKEK